MQVKDRNWPLDEVLRLLRKVSFFEGLSNEDLAQVASLVERVEVEEGEWIFREGDEGDSFYIVYSGGVELLVAHQSGSFEKLAYRRPGDAFGEMSLLDDAPRSAGARAREASVLLRVNREGFRRLLGENRIALRVMAALSRALRALDLRLSALERLGAKGGPAGGVDVAEISRVIQRGILPREAPRAPGYDLAAGTQLEDTGEGRTVWDHFPLADGRVGLAVMQVGGDGLPAGHHLALAKALFRSLAARDADLARLLEGANQGMVAAAVEGIEQPVEVGLLAVGEKAVEWAAAGRCSGAVIRRTGVLEELPSHGPPLGVLEGFRYDRHAVGLGPGDELLVLSEAPTGLFRGAADLVASLQGKPVGEIVATLQKALKKARGQAGVETSVLLLRKH